MTEYEINMQQYLENIAAQNAEMMKQFDMIRKRQQQTDEQLEELIGDRKPRERQGIVPLNDDSSEISLSCHELSLLPIFSTAAKGYVAKLDSLERKRAEQADKLDRHEAKLNDTKDRIERLKDINKMLETTAERMSIGVINNVLNSVREHNIKKLEKLEKETVPKLENKVAKDKRRINKVETNIDITQSKYDKCAAMSGIIRSFAIILNTDKRRAVFVDSVNSLHSSQCRLNEAKINKANIRLDKLCQKYEDAQTYTEANDIKIKQNKLYDKIKKLNEEKKKLEKSEYKNPFTVEEKQAADENMRSTAALMMKRAEENPTDENIAEAAQTATTKENVKSFDITEAASMLIATFVI